MQFEQKTFSVFTLQKRNTDEHNSVHETGVFANVHVSNKVGRAANSW